MSRIIHERDPMSEFAFWQRWLFIVSLFTSALGIMLAFFSETMLFELLHRQVNPVFWGAREITDEIRRFQQWTNGVLGGTVAGWGVLMAFIAYYPFRKKEKWSWNCLMAGLLVWFTIDTSISISFGVYFNAFLNCVVFTSAILPLVLTRKYFVL